MAGGIVPADMPALVFGRVPVKVITARSAGFCFGVRRAVEAVERELARGERICTLGKLMHNE